MVWWRRSSGTTEAVITESHREAARIDAEIALNVRADAKLRRQYDELVKVQAKIDALRAQGKPVPVAWITNPFHRAYYKAKGWLAEEPKS